MANVTPAGAGVSGPAIYIDGTVVANATNGYLLYNNNGVLGQIAVSSLTLDLDVGTTTITGGSTGRILYNNAGVLGEMTTVGSGTVVALATSPVFTTPTLGVAVGTSLALGGATIGSNALAVTGTALFSSSVTAASFVATKANGSTSYSTITNSSIPYTFTLYAADAGNNGFQGLGWLDSTIGPDYGLRLLTGGTLQAFGSMVAARATAIPAGGTAGTGYLFSSTSNFGVMFGSGAPNKTVAKGTLYLRSDGSGVNDRAYIATDAAGTWTALVTVA